MNKLFDAQSGAQQAVTPSDARNEKELKQKCIAL
jgi:hypothetical protein